MPFFTIACFARNVLQSSIYLPPPKKKKILTLFVTRAKTLARTVLCSVWVSAVTFLFKDASLFELRKICAVLSAGPKRRAPLWYVIALPLVCRVPQSPSNYINKPRSSDRPRVPVAPDLQQSLLLGAQHVKDFMILNAPCQTRCRIGGSALLYHPHF